MTSTVVSTQQEQLYRALHHRRGRGDNNRDGQHHLPSSSSSNPSSVSSSSLCLNVLHARWYASEWLSYTTIERFFRIGHVRHLALVTFNGHYAHRDYVATSGGTVQRFVGAGGYSPYVAVHLGPVRTTLCHAARTTHESYEIVFDIDLNDYDGGARRAGLRRGVFCQCGADKRACRGCWALLSMADVTLRWLCTQRLQLGPPLWVYSGRRGGHCLFGNRRARNLGVAERTAIVAELSRWHRPEVLDDMANDPTWVPLVAQLHRQFIVLLTQRPGMLCSSAARQWLASFVTSSRSGDAMDTQSDSDMATWRHFCEIAGDTAVARLLLDVGLPIVDLAPLRHAAPLIKMPLSIHTTTGRVSIPITDGDYTGMMDRCDAASGDERCSAMLTFDPDAVPTLHDIYSNIDDARQRYNVGVTILDTWLTQCGYPS